MRAAGRRDKDLEKPNSGSRREALKERENKERVVQFECFPSDEDVVELETCSTVSAPATRL
jgi:hypothetical protein